MTDKKRILLLTRPICPPWDEGSKNFAYTLARHANGFEIHLLTCGRVEDLPENVIQHQIYSSSKWNWPQKVRAYVFLAKEFLVKGGKNYDVLHSFFTPTLLNSLALKLVIRNRDIKIVQTLATLRDDLYEEPHIKNILTGDLLITYSDYAKEKLGKMGFRNVKRIFPGIDLSEYFPREKNKNLMERYEVSAKHFVINFTGEYSRLRAIDDVIESFISLAKDNEDFKLQLACRIKNQKDAEKKEKVAKRLRKAGYLERVNFLYDQSYKMSDIYNLSDISIFPVRNMSGKFDIPLVIIEAMACEKPIIATNIERLRYFLNSENSILINPGDREALKEKILELYNNPNERRRLGMAGKEYAVKNFDIIKVVEEYEKVYQEILS